MTNERIRLGITEEAEEQAERNLLATTDTDDLDNITIYTRGVGKRIHIEQPGLYQYLRSAGDHFRIYTYLTFGYAASLTYDMIPEEARKKILTDDHIQATHQTLLEHRENQGDPTNHESPLDIRWFFDKLRQDSPDFIDWVGQMSYSLEDPEDKNDFVLGCSIVALAFYTRADAEILAETIHSHGNPQ